MKSVSTIVDKVMKEASTKRRAGNFWMLPNYDVSEIRGSSPDALLTQYTYFFNEVRDVSRKSNEDIEKTYGDDETVDPIVKSNSSAMISVMKDYLKLKDDFSKGLVNIYNRMTKINTKLKGAIK